MLPLSLEQFLEDASYMAAYGRVKFRRSDGTFNDLCDHVVAQECPCGGHSGHRTYICRTCGEPVHNYIVGGASQ